MGLINHFPIKSDRDFLKNGLRQEMYKLSLEHRRNQSTRVISKGIRNQVEETPTGQ